MMTQRLTNVIQHKLLMKLLEFTYSIDYKKGRENTASDALSRKDHAISLATPAWVTDIEHSYLNDTHYTSIIQQLAINANSNTTLFSSCWDIKIQWQDMCWR
jgi:hypothetical protein